MHTRLFLIAAALFVSVAQAGDDDPAKKDLQRMQGMWTMHALEINGKSESKIQETLLNVAKDEYKTTVKGRQPPGFRLKLDPSKNPKWIDMIQKQPDGTEKVIKGIYTFENDTLKICRGLAPDQERPSQFATWPDTGYFVVTWKKQEK
jgi:uncharacterized protein (TIGR03067 family)